MEVQYKKKKRYNTGKAHPPTLIFRGAYLGFGSFRLNRAKAKD